MKISDKFNFETNEEFNEYVKTSSRKQLLRLYRYCQKVMRGKTTLDSVGSMMDALVIYPILREKG